MSLRYFLIFATILSSCNGRNINTLKNEKVKFEDLPVGISQYLINPSDVRNDIQTMLLELPKGQKNNYTLETVNTCIGPWIAYEKLINIEKNIYYKIDQGVPSPYIIFENKLYIPDKYNILTTSDDLHTFEFTVYDLN